MSLPLSYLQSILEQNTQKSAVAIDDSYVIELSNGKLITIGELKEFYEQKSEEEKKLQSEQKVEAVSSSDECSAAWDRPDNKEKDMQGGQSASQKPKCRRVRKSDK